MEMPEHRWVTEVLERMEREAPRQIMHRSIFRVPPSFHGEPDFVYKPYKVSIGPYYHGAPSCEAQENQKIGCAAHFIRKNRMTQRHYYEALAEIEGSLRDAYDQLDQADSASFLGMMFFDGCYLLEVMSAARHSIDSGSQYHPVFDPNEMEHYRHDMLLLENQIPLSVLVKLTSVNNLSPDNVIRDELIHLILNFFSLPSDSYAKKESFMRKDSESLHILDVYWKGVRDLKRRKRPHYLKMGQSIPRHFNIPSVTELQGARIGITTSGTPSPIDISFKRATLRFPQIALYNADRAVFFNVILFERFQRDESKDFASYVYFMNRLLKGAADISLLRSRGIISTSMHDDEVVEMFSWLCKTIPFNPHRSLGPELWDLGGRLRIRYNKNSEEWRKDLFQTYLKSPWAVISVTAAILIFILSVIQTVYTVLSYVNRK